MAQYTVRFSIKDSDGDHSYDYFNDFIIDMTESSSDDIEQEFYKRVRKAVSDWFHEDKDDLAYELDMYGYGYEYDESDGDELEYVIGRFPARSVAHIPAAIMEANGFRIKPDPEVEVEFYNDGGFLKD